ncbi:unnamed protein product [Ectocarpus sp. 6 AP-2014]
MPYNYLHDAAFRGNAKLTKTLLATGAVDVNEITEEGCTPLMISAQNGHGGVTQLLIDAGADLDAVTDEGVTGLHQAADGGHSEILSMLVKAGANPDTQTYNGSTPLYDAAFHGHLDIVRRLLRLGVRQAFPRRQSDGSTRVALDVAAQKGFTEVVRELIQHRGIKACVGQDAGVTALDLAAKHQRVDAMRLLLAAGVVDTGDSLFTAADCGRDKAVKLLLQQKWATPGAGYVDSRNDYQCTPLFVAVAAAAPKVVRLLLDAGANERLTRPVSYSFRGPLENETLLELANRNLGCEMHKGQCATEEEMNRLEEVRRLLLRVETVRAISWLWGTTSPVYAAPLGTGTNRGARGGASGLGVYIARRETRAHCGSLLATMLR